MPIPAAPSDLSSDLLSHNELIGIFVAAALTIIGWFISELSARRLQRKQLAINILVGLGQSEVFSTMLDRVFKKINSTPNYDWDSLPAKRYTGNPPYGAGEEELSNDLVNVLNHLETISIAVLNKAVDPYVIEMSLKGIVLKLHATVDGYISETNRLTNAKSGSCWCNFCTLAEKWADKKGSIAKPR